MKRRKFLKYGSAGLTLPFWLQNCDFSDLVDYPVKFNSDHETGHLLLKSKEWEIERGRDIEVAIVGGGISGLTSAYKLKGFDFALFELSKKLGGTVSTEEYQGVHFSQGAHYDLAYPENYGNEVLSLLEELEIIHYEPWSKSWSFQDKKHIIPYYRRQQCHDLGNRRRDVIYESHLKDQFIELMGQFEGEMKLPTKLINTEYHHLNTISFKAFLSSHLLLTDSFLRQVDYHMYDDYGAASNKVSALAGIHYFACRPYYKQNVPLFSPPNGNAYFADALLSRIDKSRLKTYCLVKSIEKQGNNYEIQVINVIKNKVEVIRTNKVIYAGQKHALKYIYPEQSELFSNIYAPWMVVNLITSQKKEDYGYWQNEFLGKNKRFLGFIDSSVQCQESLNGKRIFTGYYCLNPKDREYLKTIESSKEGIIKETQNYIEEMLQMKVDIESGFIKVMGHAMPIPVPNYLFNDANDSDKSKMIYAGVDNGKLPLIFEALDSGLTAASLV